MGNYGLVICMMMAGYPDIGRRKARDNNIFGERGGRMAIEGLKEIRRETES